MKLKTSTSWSLESSYLEPSLRKIFSHSVIEELDFLFNSPQNHVSKDHVYYYE